jgi:hypothetical protein
MVSQPLIALPISPPNTKREISPRNAKVKSPRGFAPRRLDLRNSETLEPPIALPISPPNVKRQVNPRNAKIRSPRGFAPRRLEVKSSETPDMNFEVTL